MKMYVMSEVRVQPGGLTLSTLNWSTLISTPSFIFLSSSFRLLTLFFPPSLAALSVFICLCLRWNVAPCPCLMMETATEKKLLPLCFISLTHCPFLVYKNCISFTSFKLQFIFCSPSPPHHPFVWKEYELKCLQWTSFSSQAVHSASRKVFPTFISL